MSKHPLDPLSAQEIEAAVSVVNQHAGLDDSAWFETVSLAEPDKAELIAYNSGSAIERRAYVCCYEPSANRTWQGHVLLSSDPNDAVLTDWTHIPGAQARIVSEEFAAADRLVKADPRFKDACNLRGITNLDDILVCLLYTSPSPRDLSTSRMPSSA